MSDQPAKPVGVRVVLQDCVRISAVAAVMMLALGCGSSGDKPKQDREMRAEAAELFGSGAASGDGGAGTATDGAASAASGGGWSILIERFTGPGHEQAAVERLDGARRTIGRSDVRLVSQPNGTALVVGMYEAPTDPAAQAELERIQGLTAAGGRPYLLAFMWPTPVTDPGRVPELSLTTARRAYGPDARYTLQIAVYDSEDPAERKRMAEQAALQLRRDGDLGWYYHGRHTSAVTVGVFTDADYDEQRGPISPAVTALQRRYELNLANGRFPILIGPNKVPQRSALVRIPE